MIYKLFAGILLIASLIVGLTIYLQPNDLAVCEIPLVTEPDCQTADAIVVISGGNTAYRVAAGVELYNEGWAPVLIFSGAAQDKSGPSNAQVMAEQAVANGVPEDAIVVEEYSETTRQNAEEVATIARQNGYDDLILVTSGYHQRRASIEFNAALAGVATIRNYPIVNDGDWGWFWWLTPRGWYLAVGEGFKIIALSLGISS